MGKAALLLWVLLGIPVFGWNKFNDLSGACVSEADHITPETAKGVLKKAWKQSLSFAGGLSCAIFLMMKDKSPNSPNALILIFTGLIFLLSAIGVYSSVSMRVKRALRELHQED